MVAVGDAGAGDGGDLRSPVGGQGVVRQFDHIEQTGRGFPEGLAKKLKFLVGCLGVLRTALLVRGGEVYAHIREPETATGSSNLPAMIVPGKLGLVQLNSYSCRPPETSWGLPVLPLPITR